MVVRGDPGVGKSLLISVMAEYVRRTGGDVRMLYSEEGYESKPFHPVRSHFAAGPSSSAGIESAQNTRAGTMETLIRSEEHTSELQSLMRSAYAVFCLKKKRTRQSR